MPLLTSRTRLKIALALAVAVLGSACSDVTSVSDQTLVVRGTVTTGAHTATPVSGGYVRVMMPQGSGGGHWIGLDFASGSGVPNKAVTNSDGSYTFSVDYTSLPATHSYPLYLAASDSAQTLTMLSELPQDTATPGAQLSIDINPVTTAAGQMICPGGAYPPPADSWCYSDPNNPPSVFNNQMINTLNTALAGSESGLNTGTPPNWQTFSTGFLNDPATFGDIKNILTGQGVTFGSATASTIESTIGGAALPLVTVPTATDANTPTSSSGTGGGGCELTWDCTTLSPGAEAGCAADYGSPTGNLSEPNASACASACTTAVCKCQGC